MFDEALPMTLPAAALFGGLALMSDRKLGASLAQAAVALAGVVLFVAILAGGPVAGLQPRDLVAIAIGLMAAAVAGMLYHLYLGRFTRVWAARGVFLGVFLALSAGFGLVFLSLI